MRIALQFAGLIVGLMAAANGYAGVADSLHNLSASGPGSVKSAAGNRICVFCHMSHSTGESEALWGRKRTTQAAFIPYSSSTAIARPGQPTGTSILCLSCHDGTIALGEILNQGRPQGRNNLNFVWDVLSGEPLS